MHVLNIALAILGLSSTSLSYYIHPSCDCYNDNGKNNIEAGIQEAINILEYSGSVANMCADPDDPIVISGGKPYGQLCENDRNSNLLQDFFQDDSPEMYQKVADALLPASKSAVERSNQPDNAFTIVCGDSHLNRISSTTYRDRDRDFAYVGMTPTVPEGGRPCDVVEALAYFTAKGSVVMICDSQNRGVNQAPTNEFLNKRNIIGKDVEWLARTISGVFVHEMTHIGDSNAFPRDLGNGQMEAYRYVGCVGLADTPEALKNCDSFAIVARAMYMNNYFVQDGVMKILPKRVRVPRHANPEGED